MIITVLARLPTSPIMASRVVLITGANRGLGRRTVERLLLESSNYRVIMTARSAAEGAKALSEIQALGDFQSRLLFHPLDVNSAASVAQLTDYVTSTVGAVDVLVNNAGIYLKERDLDLEAARQTIGTNFLATVDLTEALLPVIRPGGHIVMVSSRLGQLNRIPGEAVRARLLDTSQGLQGLKALAHGYIQSVEDRSADAKGWPRDAYLASKNLLNAYVRARAPELQSSHIRLNALCPGWVRTDMGGPNGMLSIDEGTETHLQLIRDLGNSTGQFWYEGHVGEW